MRYKIARPPLVAKMELYGQTIESRVAYLQHTIAVLMSKEHFRVFNALSIGYNIYFMLLNDAFELLRLRYADYLIIVQATPFQYSIQISKL